MRTNNGDQLDRICKLLSTGTDALPAVAKSCGFDRPWLQKYTAKNLVITLTISNTYDTYSASRWHGKSAFLGPFALVLPLRSLTHSQAMQCMSCAMHAMCIYIQCVKRQFLRTYVREIAAAVTCSN